MKLPPVIRTTFAVAVALVGGVVFADSYSIKITETIPTEAARIAEQLRADGLSPVEVREHGATSAVYFGSFDVYAETIWYVQDLRNLGYAEVKAQKLDAAPTGDLTYGYYSVFEGLRDQPDLVYDQQDSRTKPFYEHLKRNDLATAKVEAQKIIDDETAGALRGWATLRLGYMSIKEGNKETAFGLFKAVADGLVPASLADRLDAANRAARLLYARKDRIRSLQAFRELLALQTEPTDRAQTLVEIAGLTLELARSSKGSFDDAREACQRVIRESDNSMPVSRATAELMYLETYAFQPEPDYQRVVDLSRDFIPRYEAQRKQCGMAMYWLGTSLRELGQIDEAEAVFLDIVKRDFSDKEVYPSCNVMAQAALELAVICYNRAKYPEANHWRSWVKERYPTDEAAKTIDQYFVGFDSAK